MKRQCLQGFVVGIEVLTCRLVSRHQLHRLRKLTIYRHYTEVVMLGRDFLPLYPSDFGLIEAPKVWIVLEELEGKFGG